MLGFFFFLVLLPIQTSDTPKAKTPLWTEPPFPALIFRSLVDVVVALVKAVSGICRLGICQMFNFSIPIFFLQILPQKSALIATFLALNWKWTMFYSSELNKLSVFVLTYKLISVILLKPITTLAWIRRITQERQFSWQFYPSPKINDTNVTCDKFHVWAFVTVSFPRFTRNVVPWQEKTWITKIQLNRILLLWWADKKVIHKQNQGSILWQSSRKTELRNVTDMTDV